MEGGIAAPLPTLFRRSATEAPGPGRIVIALHDESDGLASGHRATILYRYVVFTGTQNARVRNQTRPDLPSVYQPVQIVKTMATRLFVFQDGRLKHHWNTIRDSGT